MILIQQSLFLINLIMEACLQARLIGFEDILGKVAKSSLKHYFQGVL